jgi:hypothetical protein
MGGTRYCGSCKVLAIQGLPAFVEEATIPCVEADEAFKYALIGIVCFGIIVGPVAISKALKAKKKIALNPRLMGEGKATAALILGIAVLVLWVLRLISGMSKIDR